MKLDFFKNLFKKSGVEGGGRRLDDDYETDSGKHDFIIVVISLLCAVAIWIYAISAGNVVIP